METVPRSRDHETIGNNFLVRKFMGIHYHFFSCTKHAVKHTFELKNISVYDYCQKSSMSILKHMSEEGQVIC